MSVMPETVASRVATNNAEALVEAGSTQLIRVEPNDSRVDCSNYNPLDVWNMGVQMAALHFQVKIEPFITPCLPSLVFIRCNYL